MAAGSRQNITYIIGSYGPDQNDLQSHVQLVLQESPPDGRTETEAGSDRCKAGTGETEPIEVVLHADHET